jgi:hypothetical protein
MKSSGELVRIASVENVKRIAMMVITTNSSSSVNPPALFDLLGLTLEVSMFHVMPVLMFCNNILYHQFRIIQYPRS